jgi:hypothetical protein
VLSETLISCDCLLLTGCANTVTANSCLLVASLMGWLRSKQRHYQAETVNGIMAWSSRRISVTVTIG